MADKTDTIRQEIKEGRQNIEDTRSAMTEKLAILEDRVQETVDGVKHTFDLHYQNETTPVANVWRVSVDGLYARTTGPSFKRNS